MDSVTIYLATEDALSEAVLRRITEECGRSVKVDRCFRKAGFGYLAKNISAFNQASKYTPFFVLRDLDDVQCPPELMRRWMGTLDRNPNLLVHIAVRQVESWILAHRKAFASFFFVPENSIPPDADGLRNAKLSLIELIRRKSRNRLLRGDIVPQQRSSAKQGRNYNAPMCAFARGVWDPREAMMNSPSLERAVLAIEEFTPIPSDNPFP